MWLREFWDNKRLCAPREELDDALPWMAFPWVPPQLSDAVETIALGCGVSYPIRLLAVSEGMTPETCGATSGFVIFFGRLLVAHCLTPNLPRRG